MEKKKKQIRCPKCTNFFNSTDELKLHVETSCSQCEKCTHWFKSPTAVTNHVTLGKCKPIICKICGKVWQRQAYLKAHMLMHNDEMPFSCGHCDFKCRTESDLKKHSVRIHKVNYESTTVNCQNCKLKCGTQEILDQHMKNDCKQCEKCEKWCQSEDVLKNHPCKPRVCPICGKRYKFPAYLVDHLETHESKSTVKCTYCEKQFSLKRFMEAHIKKVHQVEFNRDQVSCNNCKKVCFSKKDLDHHMNNECRRCSECSTTFPSAQAMKDHSCVPTTTRKRKFVSSPPPSTSVVAKGGFEKLDRPFKCTFCEKTFTMSMSLLTHIRVLHDINYTDNMVKCDKCHKVYYFQEELTKHQKDECTMCKRCKRWFPCPDALKTHQTTGVCTIKKCYKCGRVCQDRHKLAIHMRMHTKEKPFKCDFCRVKYRYPSSLLRHLGKHHPNEYKRKIVKCNRCKDMFTSLKELIQHQKKDCTQCLECESYYPSKKHHEKHICKPRKCRICGRRFRWPAGLAAHMRTHTKDRAFKCDQCDSKFKHPANFFVHKARFHRAKVDDDSDSKVWKCPYCEAVLTSGDLFKKHLKNHLRCKCGRKFKGMGQMSIHSSWCGKKCNYCSVGFFIGLKEFNQHQDFCNKRNDFKCPHCKSIFNRRTIFFQHVRNYCLQRPLLFKCDCCDELKHGSLTDPSEALQHFMQCKPTGGRLNYECFICQRRFTKEIISYHIQDELLHSRLFKDIPCTFKCKSCEIGFPSKDLLDLHNHLEHPCLVNVQKSWNDELLLDLADIHMPPEKQELLKIQRQLIRDKGLESYEFDGKLPIHKCYVCLHPFHSLTAMQLHARACEKKYGLIPDKSKYTQPMQSIRVTKKKTRAKKDEKSAGILRKLLRQIKFDIERNPQWVIRDVFWGSLEKKYNVAPGYALYWLPHLVRDEPYLKEYFKDKLTEICIIPESCNQKEQPILVDVSDDEEGEEEEGSRPLILWACKTCGKACNSRKELALHKGSATPYFHRKQNSRKAKPARSQKQKFPEKERGPEDYDDLDKWIFNGEQPQHKCKFCRHPYHSYCVKTLHERICKDRQKEPDHEQSIEEMEVDNVPVLAPRRFLTKTVVKSMLDIPRTTFRNNDLRESRKVGHQSHWTKMSSIFNVPADRLRKWHTGFPAHKSKEKAIFEAELAKVLKRMKRF